MTIERVTPMMSIRDEAACLTVMHPQPRAMQWMRVHTAFAASLPSTVDNRAGEPIAARRRECRRNVVHGRRSRTDHP